MSETIIRLMNDPSDPLLRKLPSLFGSMYDEMRPQGLMLDISGDGPQKWLEGVSRTLGKTSCIVGAITGDDLAGFAHGSLRFTPDYLGSQLTGMVSHIYVCPDMRREGIARKLLEQLEGWFIQKKVSSIDLQVVSGNEAAHAFWLKSGYKTELVQYRKVLK
jgi:GNAT superfamily N-acetyltransferase